MGLEFVNPLLLAGVAAAAVPIVLHLIMRQQPRLLEFPALRFVRLNSLRYLRQCSAAGSRALLHPKKPMLVWPPPWRH